MHKSAFLCVNYRQAGYNGSAIPAEVLTLGRWDYWTPHDPSML